jgi:hypothetical protein
MLFLCGNKGLKKALSIEEQGKRHVALAALAKKIGVSTLHYRGGAKGYRPADEAELVARVRDAMRTDAALYAAVLASLSAMGALFSALAAWCAVVSR